MMYIYSSIILLTLLSGCSWWDNADVTPCNTQHIPSHTESPGNDTKNVAPTTCIIDNQSHRNECSTDQEEQNHTAPLIVTQEPPVESDETKVTQKSRRAFKQRRTKKKVATTESYDGKSIADLLVAERPAHSAAPAPCYTYIPTQSTSSDNESNNNTAPQQAVLNIENSIDTSMLTVKHWSGTYFPTKLTVEINGQMTKIVENGTLLQQKQLVVPVTEKKLAVTYNYEFMQGMRKEEKSVQYKVADNTDALKMSFDWDTPWHVTFDHAQPI